MIKMVTKLALVGPVLLFVAAATTLALYIHGRAAQP